MCVAVCDCTTELREQNAPHTLWQSTLWNIVKERVPLNVLHPNVGGVLKHESELERDDVRVTESLEDGHFVANGFLDVIKRVIMCQEVEHLHVNHLHSHLKARLRMKKTKKQRKERKDLDERKEKCVRAYECVFECGGVHTSSQPTPNASPKLQIIQHNLSSLSFAKERCCFFLPLSHFLVLGR